MPIISILPTLQIQTDNLVSIYISHTNNKIYVFYKSSKHPKQFDCQRHGGCDIVANAFVDKLFTDNDTDILFPKKL